MIFKSTRFVGPSGSKYGKKYRSVDYQEDRYQNEFIQNLSGSF